MRLRFIIVRQSLNKSDILHTNRSFQGGNKLAQAHGKYTIGTILRLTEGSLAPVSCLDQEPIQCECSNVCATLPIRQGLNKVINDHLDNITLQDILDQQKELYYNDYMI
ncbi:MAG: Rrf2 family transcriptional regulator [Clostridia bacterium]|nr:Rrf2 family transcriptional regulator [Clostridia bacterium]